jgi:predicted DNA-binding protein YlxM (UPF0122 family)
MKMTNNLERHWRGRIIGALRAYLRTGAEVDRADLIAEVNQMVEAYGRLKHLTPYWVSTIKTSIRTKDLPELFRRRGEGELKADDTLWETLRGMISRHIEAAVDDQRSNNEGLGKLNDKVAAVPALGSPPPSSAEAEYLATQTEDESAIIREEYEAALDAELPKSNQVLEEFFQRRSEARTPVYRLIEHEPERYRLLIALLVALGPEKFEALVEAYANEDLHIPGSADYKDFDRNRRILELYNKGTSIEELAEQFELKPISIYKIIEKERKGLRSDIEATNALLNELNKARAMVRDVYVAQALHRRVALNREKEQGPGGGRERG